MMVSNASSFDAQLRGWRTLRRLHPVPIDLGRIALIREQPASHLSRPENLERLLPRLGINDEGLEEFPPELRPFCGQGLRVWQYPTQFGKYLARIASLGVRSYVEIGIRHGGSFVTTVELLERFRRLSYAVAVDIIPCPTMAQYTTMNPRAEFVCMNTLAPEFREVLARLRPIDLIFIDSHHEEDQCRRECTLVREFANMLALHDISNIGCPGIGKVWQEIKRSGDFACFEFTDQYAGLGPYMGIGLAVKRERLTATGEAAPAEADR